MLSLSFASPTACYQPDSLSLALFAPPHGTSDKHGFTGLHLRYTVTGFHEVSALVSMTVYFLSLFFFPLSLICPHMPGLQIFSLLLLPLILAEDPARLKAVFDSVHLPSLSVSGRYLLRGKLVRQKLLDGDMKILAEVLVAWFQAVIPSLIHHTQVGFGSCTLSIWGFT